MPLFKGGLKGGASEGWLGWRGRRKTRKSGVTNWGDIFKGGSPTELNAAERWSSKNATKMPFNLINRKLFETFERGMSIGWNGQKSYCTGLEWIRPPHNKVTFMIMKRKKWLW